MLFAATFLLAQAIAGTPQQAASFEALVSIVAPFAECARGFDARRIAINDRLSADIGPGDLQAANRAAATAKIGRALEGLRLLNIEVDRTCDHSGIFARFKETVRGMQPGYSGAEVANFADTLFRDIVKQGEAVADFRAGRFKAARLTPLRPSERQ